MSNANPRTIDKDSIYYSRERWRIVPRRVEAARCGDGPGQQETQAGEHRWLTKK